MSTFLDVVKRVIESSLPTSNAIVAKVIHVVYDTSSSAKDVADVIEHDPTLTANVLKVANSAYYGTAANIVSIQRAVVILGFNSLKELVMTISTVHFFQTEDIYEINDLKDLWYHSIGTAKACKFISERMSIERPEIAYLVGLLHDIGKIILFLYFPEHYRAAVQLAAEKNTRIILAERKIMNTDHASIGGLLCELWALPESLKMPIMHHHDPAVIQGEGQRLARIVELGDYLCRKARIGFAGDEAEVQPSPAAMALLGTGPDSVKQNYEMIIEKLRESETEIYNFFQKLELRF